MDSIFEIKRYIDPEDERIGAYQSVENALSKEKKNEIIQILRELEGYANEGNVRKILEDDAQRRLAVKSFAPDEMDYALIIMRHLYPKTFVTPLPSLPSIRKPYAPIAAVMPPQKLSIMQSLFREAQNLELEGFKRVISEDALTQYFAKNGFTQKETDYALAVTRHFFPRNFGDRRGQEEINYYIRYYFDLYFDRFYTKDSLGRWLVYEESARHAGAITAITANIRYIDPSTFGLRPVWWTPENELFLHAVVLKRVEDVYVAPLRAIIAERAFMRKKPDEQRQTIDECTTLTPVLKTLFVQVQEKRVYPRPMIGLVAKDSAPVSENLALFLKEAFKVWTMHRYEGAQEEFTKHADAIADKIKTEYFITVTGARNAKTQKFRTLSKIELLYLPRILALLAQGPGQSLRVAHEIYNASGNEYRKAYEEAKKTFTA